MTEKSNYYLDITSDVCPMTFVRTKLLVERMAPGETLELRLKGVEPLANVPRSVAELGHAVEGPIAEDEADPTGAYRLLIRKVG